LSIQLASWALVNAARSPEFGLSVLTSNVAAGVA